MLGLLVTEKKIKVRQNNKPSLDFILKGIFTIDGWSEDKEKFKIELVNDIKDFLFTKWEKPWKAGLVFSESGKLLSGFRNINGRVYKNLANIMTLGLKSDSNPFFITIKKLRELGGKILDKDKVLSIVSYIPIWKDQKNKTPRRPDFMLPKFHKAINLEYVEGVETPKYEKEDFQKLELNQYVENFINELKKKKRIPSLIYDQSDKCFYRHGMLDYDPESIHLVRINNFKNIEAYYSTLFHEITHSTKNPARLGRGKLILEKTLDYANEELVAEMGAMIICEELGLQYNRQNSLTYLKGWLSRTKNVDTALLETYSYASDAAEYLLKDIDLNKLVPESMRKRISVTEQKEDKKKDNKQMSLCGVDDVNKEFNHRLDLLISGDLKDRSPFFLGFPSKSLLATKIPILPIEMAVNRLNKKSVQKNHTFDLEKLKNLPKAIENPIAIFKSKTQANSRVILTELKNENVNFVVALELSKEVKKGIIINSIRSVYPKDSVIQILKWICKDDLLQWADKRKTLNWMNKQQSNSADVAHLIECSTKVIQNFNKSKSQKKDSLKGCCKNDKTVTSLSNWQPNTEITKLKGNLGQFIGGYEHNQFAIVLRGEKGAGKTRLLCQMIDLFAKQNLKSLFLSFEVSPESELFGNYISYISPKARKHVAVSSQNTIKELESYCKQYDVIAIDSWGKLQNVSQEDFGRLVEKYPNVIWLCIFQSTTNGTARGGIMSEYDSSIVIQVAKGGLAVCEKNRYNSCEKIYNVFNKKLVKNETI